MVRVPVRAKFILVVRVRVSVKAHAHNVIFSGGGVSGNH